MDYQESEGNVSNKTSESLADFPSVSSPTQNPLAEEETTSAEGDKSPTPSNTTVKCTQK